MVYIDELSEEAKARVGLEFNPGNNAEILLAKALCVGAVEMATRLSRTPMRTDHPESGHFAALASRAAATAATEFEKGQMLLVKAVVHAAKV
jgi:hypothetical protein